MEAAKPTGRIAKSERGQLHRRGIGREDLRTAE